MDEPLLHRVARGEPDGFERCIDAYGPLVWALARRFCACEEDARDGAQEAFLALWKAAGRFDPDRASERTFVAMVARRRLIDRWRSIRRRPAEVELPEEAAGSPPGTVPHAAARASTSAGAEVRTVERLMGRLSEAERHVLDLSLFHGMSQTEIAHRLSLPVGTVKSHARRGLDRIRRSLAREEWR
ncbi:MAG: sigma-70 family RNA polymerase sigma factor [Myxococcota bacterium]